MGIEGSENVCEAKTMLTLAASKSVCVVGGRSEMYGGQVIFFPRGQVRKKLKFNYVVYYINRIRKKIKDWPQ